VVDVEADEVPVDDAVVEVVEPAAAAAVTVVVVVDVGSDAATVVVVDASDADADAEAGAAVVWVVPAVWALTECTGTTARPAMAPPVVTAAPKAATSALFLMRSSLGLLHQMPLGCASDSAPNP
jgi:hypothetical protein